jgi:hypothetical protein
LLEAGAVIVRNPRRVRLFLARAFPYRRAFLTVAKRFASGQILPSAGSVHVMPTTGLGGVRAQLPPN